MDVPSLTLQPLEGKRYPPVEQFASARADERTKIAEELREIAAKHKARGHAVKAAAVEAAARRIRENGR